MFVFEGVIFVIFLLLTTFSQIIGIGHPKPDTYDSCYESKPIRVM